MAHPHAAKIMQFAKMVEAGHPIDELVQVKDTPHQDWCPCGTPGWYTRSEYRVALAFIEGKPVFEGDTLYDSKGEKFSAVGFAEGVDVIKCTNSNFENSYLTISMDGLSWNPPKPKTIVVEIPAPRLLHGNICADKNKFSMELEFSTNDELQKALRAFQGAWS